MTHNSARTEADMRAVLVTSLDGPTALEVAHIRPPDTGEGVLIDVRAAGVAFPDLLLSRGLYQVKPEPPFVPGSEVAGLVVSAPAESGLRTGDRVAAFCIHGGWAERVNVHPSLVFKIPSGLTFAEAAGMPMNYLTAHFALARRARLKADEWVLIHGAAGGLGIAHIHVAQALGGRVIAVASTEDKRKAALAAGAHHAIAVEDFQEHARSVTDGRGVDIVVDPVGGERVVDSLRSLSVEGRLLVLGFTGGDIPTVRVNRLLHNNVSVIGVGWGAFLTSHPDYAADQWAEILPLVESGLIAPTVGHKFPLERAAEALELIAARAAVGKVVLTI